MKMSDYFNLPVEITKIHIDEKQLSRSLHIGDGGECKSISQAVNNFDNMYEALQSICNGEGLKPGTTIEGILAKARGEL